jgi:hypothetical protein
MNLQNVFLLILAFLAAGLFVYFHYFFREKRTKSTFYLAVLRFLSIFAILILLINPKIEKREYSVIKPKLLVAVDNSSSIKFSKSQNTLENSLALIKNNTSLQEKFDIDYFTFGNTIENNTEITFDENQTNIKKALHELNAMAENQIAPIILLTDGNQTFGSNYKYYQSKQAIYPIMIGDTVTITDLEISQINVNEYTYLNNKFPVEAFIRYSGKETIRTNFVVREDNTILYQQKVTLTKENNFSNIQFYSTADKIGKHVFQATIEPLQGEKNRLNNVKNFAIEVMDEQTKIALIYDVLHPDVGMLKESIEINPQRKVTLLDINSSMDNLEENNIYIVYQPNQKFQSVFNRLKNNSKNYIIITGNATNWNFLNNAQEIFTKNVLAKSQEYLPDFQTNFTTFPVEDISFSNFSPLEDSFGEIKFSVPFESILTQTIDGITTESPLLASFTVDNQRGISLFGENIWKWRALSYAREKSFVSFDNFINSMLQYVTITTKTNQIDLTYNVLVYSDEPVIISAKTYDANLNFDENANLELILEKDQRSKPFLLKGNRFEINLNNLEPGAYNFIAKNVQNNTHVTGKFTVVSYSMEQENIQANVSDLQLVAESSKGNAFYPDQTEELLQNLVNDSNYVSVQKEVKQTVTLIDWRWLLGLIVLSLSIEWFIRKYKGLI